MTKQGLDRVQRRKAIRRSCLSLRAIAGLAICLGLAAVGGRAFGAEELVRNPRFAPSPAADAPAEWSAWLPDWEPARCTIRATSDGLRIDVPGRPFAVGGVWQQVSGVREKQAYAIEAVCQVENIAAPFQSLHVRVEWLQAAKQLHPAGMLVRGPLVDKDDKNLVRFADVLVAPAGADAARLTLEIKWPRGGSILWKQVAMHETSPPAPRKVKIGTVYLRPRGSTPEKNLDLYCGQVDEAGRLGLDIVCLGEAITMVGTAKRAVDVAEPIPGPSTERLGEAARRNRLWVVAGLTERVDDRVYNTAVLLDRQGQVAGKYRKVHLPREEWKQGITPGDEYPVFQTDFGTVAIQICYDWFFPESHDIFALRAPRSCWRRPGATPCPTRTAVPTARRSSALAPATTGSTWSRRSTTAAAWSSIRWAASWPRTRDARACSGPRST